jgi:hypothetical protein
VIGRADTQLKVRGFRVEAGEIEARLLQADGVREAAVVAVAGEHGAFLLAALTGSADPAAVLVRLRDELPAHLVPARVLRLDSLPRTRTGKVDRRALAALAAVGPGTEKPLQAPRTPVESALVALWTELLGVGRVSVDDSFFELGGHSILAARLVARARDLFRVDLQIPDVFRRPRLEDLAAVIGERQAERDGDVDTLLDELEHLSDDELRALLGESASPNGETA